MDELSCALCLVSRLLFSRPFLVLTLSVANFLCLLFGGLEIIASLQCEGKQNQTFEASSHARAAASLLSKYARTHSRVSVVTFPSVDMTAVAVNSSGSSGSTYANVYTAAFARSHAAQLDVVLRMLPIAVRLHDDERVLVYLRQLTDTLDIMFDALSDEMRVRIVQNTTAALCSVRLRDERRARSRHGEQQQQQ